MKVTKRATVARTATVGTAATVALLSLQHQAHASTIHIDGPITATGIRTYAMAGINVDGVGGDDLRLSAASLAFFHSALGVVRAGRVGMRGINDPGNGVLADAAGLIRPLRKLASGSVISAGAGAFLGDDAVAKGILCYPAACVYSTGAWANGVPALAGFRFVDGGGTHFGWIRLLWNDTNHDTFPDSITALDWGYESTPGAAIEAGDTGASPVPEPSSALMLLAGAGALALSRRRGAKVAAPQAAPIAAATAATKTD
jgi:hypothetical protein